MQATTIMWLYRMAEKLGWSYFEIDEKGSMQDGAGEAN
jgi:hypothetical protein